MSLRQTIQQVIEKVLTWAGFRVEGRFLVHQINVLWEQCKASFVNALAQSAWAAGNSVNVGMTETAEVLNPMLPQPSTEQIYTTQPAWDFNEEQSYRLGSYVDIDASGNIDTPIYDDGWSDPQEGYTRYPIPSLIYDTDGDAHVVFPVWMWDMTGEFVKDGGVPYSGPKRQKADGTWEGRENGVVITIYPVTKYMFRPMNIPFRHNCNYFGGGLDGFLWQQVATSGTWSGSNVQVTVGAEYKQGTFCRINGTDSGIVTAVEDNGDDTYTLTLGCLCGLVATGTTITKVELYKPLQV